MTSKLRKKLDNLPKTPGVYFFKDKSGKIIYIGKASILKRRVGSYFQKRHSDYKTPLLVENIRDLDFVETSSEVEALFLEAELIKRHKPIYNVRERDDKNFIYIKISTQDEFPAISLVRRPSDDKARYFGPFVYGYAVKQALRYLRRIFPYYTKSERQISSKLEYQIGTVPNPNLSSKEYRKNINRLILIIEGKTKKLLSQLERQMRKLSAEKNYEQAAAVRNQYLALKALSNKVVFGREESIDLSADVALGGLVRLLNLSKIPRRIECYDISNFAGGDAVSSMVVFSGGVPDQKEYRHFKMNTKGPNDFAMMQETIRRRFSTRNSKWPKPDLMIIDGGKGQLSSVAEVLDEFGINIPTFGLAKRYETIVSAEKVKDKYEFGSIQLEKNSVVLQLLQRIRDEAHRFAVSYHSTLRKKRTKSSQLDTIVGIGPATKKKLLRKFGSVVGIKKARKSELAEVIGKAKAATLYEQLSR